MRGKAFRIIAALLTVLILTNSPVKASPVAFNDVMQRIRDYRNPAELRLRPFSQTSHSYVVQPDRYEPGATTTNGSYDGRVEIVDSTAAPLTASQSLLGGIATYTDEQQPVDIVVAQGDVEATICDCGEILVAGGWPKWPLLFLAAIPFFFIDGNDEECVDCIRITPTPTPTPTTTPNIPSVPEPTSILLFGSGLAAFGAALRRRRIRANQHSQSDTTEEG